MKFLSNITSVVLGVLVGVVLGFIINDYHSIPTINTVVRTEVRYITDTQYVSVPKIVRVVEPQEVILPDNCDSLRSVCYEVVKDYNTRKYYQDTLKLDTLGTVLLKQQVINNSIDSLEYVYTIAKTTHTTITNVVNPSSNGVFVGISAGYKSITPNLQYMFKNKYTISVGYDVLNKSFMVGSSIKIK